MAIRRVLIIAISLMICQVAAASADVTCTVTVVAEARIEVFVEPDAGPLVASQIITESNATIDLARCLTSNLPMGVCTFHAKALGSPAEVEVHFQDSDDDVWHPCGPYGGPDGLPVELIEFSVE